MSPEKRSARNALKRLDGGRDPEEVRAENFRNTLKSKYGLTVEDHERMLLEQEGRCAICGNVPDSNGARNQNVLNVDHDHETGKVRALLCYYCNLALGYMKDDPERLKKAAAYLESYM